MWFFFFQALIYFFLYLWIFYRFQLLTCDDLLLFFVEHDKLNIFWCVSQTKPWTVGSIKRIFLTIFKYFMDKMMNRSMPRLWSLVSQPGDINVSLFRAPDCCQHFCYFQCWFIVCHCASLSSLSPFSPSPPFPFLSLNLNWSRQMVKLKGIGLDARLSPALCVKCL